jgi:hypothetical protein
LPRKQVWWRVLLLTYSLKEIGLLSVLCDVKDIDFPTFCLRCGKITSMKKYRPEML